MVPIIANLHLPNDYRCWASSLVFTSYLKIWHLFPLSSLTTIEIHDIFLYSGDRSYITGKKIFSHSLHCLFQFLQNFLKFWWNQPIFFLLLMPVFRITSCLSQDVLNSKNVRIFSSWFLICSYSVLIFSEIVIHPYPFWLCWKLNLGP